MKLEDLRKKINSIDKNIVKILKKRMDVSVEIGHMKKVQKKLIIDPIREDEVLKNILHMNKETRLNVDFLKRIFMEILKESRKNQNI